MARRKGWRAVKSHESYTVEEVARNQGVAKGTVRRWLKSGLPSLNEKRPTLILGGDLVDYLKGRKGLKQSCKLEECYCFKCKAPRKPAFGDAEYQLITSTSGQLIGLCCECATLMHKRFSTSSLGKLNGLLTLTTRKFACEPLGGGQKAVVFQSLER